MLLYGPKVPHTPTNSKRLSSQDCVLDFDTSQSDVAISKVKQNSLYYLFDLKLETQSRNQKGQNSGPTNSMSRPRGYRINWDPRFSYHRQIRIGPTRGLPRQIRQKHFPQYKVPLVKNACFSLERPS